MRLVSHLSKAIRDLGISNTQFADQAGVARSTVQKLIGQDFKELRVDTIERIAARLGTTDITSLFTLRDDTEEFLAPFRATKAVTFLFGTHDVGDPPQGRSRTTIDVWDFRAQNELLQHLRAHVPELRDEMRFFSKESFGDEQRDEVLALARKQNTVVIGSPKVNPVCEFLLRELFPGARGGRRRGPRLRLAERPLA
ncbi:MAG: helix-turn-helix domain-containing protein, partial [Planctomycetota bacterium JB042]